MGLFKKDLTTVLLNVEGMKCVHCEKRVVDTLKNSKVITLDEIKSIINELGFECK